MSTTVPQLILGSASPRRRELLAELGVNFSVQSVDVDEDQITVADPALNVIERAGLKAEALKGTYGTKAIILTADTTVVYEGRMLNKPLDEDEARSMLKALRGTPHQVYTGMVIVDLKLESYKIVNKTDVVMRPYSDDEIDAYILTGDPMDKAGAYAIQHTGFRPVYEMKGCFAGVMGLGLCDLGPLFESVLLDNYQVNTSFVRPNSINLCPFCHQKFTEITT